MTTEELKLFICYVVRLKGSGVFLAGFISDYEAQKYMETWDDPSKVEMEKIS
jgi:hypothetical protein